MRTQQDINRQWTESADNYDDIIQDELNSFRLEGWQKLIKSQIGGATGLKVLDTGCGPAFFTIILARAGYQVTAIDGSSGMLEKARKNIAEYGVTAEIMEMDCHDLSFPDNTFDLIVSRNVTHALRDHKRVYQEWKRVLKPGGVLLIFDANWHLPLASREMYEESMKLARECIRIYGSDFNGHTNPDDYSLGDDLSERDHLLGDRIRPDWDLGLLEGLGYAGLEYQRDITAPLWDEKEKLIYRNTPMFMIKALKPAA